MVTAALSRTAAAMEKSSWVRELTNGYRCTERFIKLPRNPLNDFLRDYSVSGLGKANQLSIADIADATGFSDPGYFHKRIKRAFGHTLMGFRFAALR